MNRSRVISGYVIAIAAIAIALGGALSAWGVVPALALAAILLPALVVVAGAQLFLSGAARILAELRGAGAATRPVTSAARRCA